MKNFVILNIIAVLFVSNNVNAQIEISPNGGGQYNLEPTEHNCLSDVDRNEIQARLSANVAQLELEGRMNFGDDREDVQFIWPLQKADGFEWNDYFGISNFVDQDPSGALLDYNCDMRTYEGHFGVDIFTWPFPWYMVENDLVEIIAGEDGIIIAKDDGFDDDHCECFGSWNAVYVQHADGSVAWYGHMKRGSLTAKGVGESVSQGEFLGIVASSGCSTGPHLHFEVYDADVNLIDPFSGDCNALNETSWWEDQPENRDPRINVLLTHDQVPEHGCPTVNEDPHFMNDFYIGDVVYTAGYFHDALAGTSTNYRIRNSNGLVWQEWTSTNAVTYNASWWYWSWYLPAVGPFGVWTFEADYSGETVIHEFNYGVYAGVDEAEIDDFVIAPNPSNNGIITISGIDEMTHITLINALGEEVQLASMNSNGLIDLSAFGKGMYFLRLTSDNKRFVKKIILE